MRNDLDFLLFLRAFCTKPHFRSTINVDLFLCDRQGESHDSRIDHQVRSPVFFGVLRDAKCGWVMQVEAENDSDHVSLMTLRMKCVFIIWLSWMYNGLG